LLDCWGDLNKDAASGVDDMIAKAYAADLHANIEALAQRLNAKRYRTKLVRRWSIPKGNGKERPLGIPAFEGKVVQRAVARLLGAIYEQDFHGGSYGFREGRGPHQALHKLRERCMNEHIGWIIDADVSAFFDNLDYDLWCEVLRQRVNDGAILRLIRKRLRAGVLEGDTLSYPERGSPQGGVVFPMLADTFLDHVLEAWFEREVKPRMKVRCFLIRFADDVVMGCEREDEARRILVVLPKRFARFQLSIHPQKTRLVRFQPPHQEGDGEHGDGTFDVLGPTHYWAKSRRGCWVIKRRTAKKRLRRAMRVVWPWCRTQRHEPLRAQYWVLCQKLRGQH